MKTVPIAFPPGEILDQDAFVWTTLPPGTSVQGTRLVGECSCDASELSLERVTIERGGERLTEVIAIRPISFPTENGFLVAVTGLAVDDPRTWSTAEAPIRIVVHVRRSRSGGATIDGRGRPTGAPAGSETMVTWLSKSQAPDPVTFRLTLHARAAGDPS